MSNVLGGGGNDSLTGTADRDYMLGGAGNDTIDSGAGYDWVEGGTGADTFVFKPGCGWDCIGDFKVAEGDRIDLSAWSGLRSLADLTISSDGGDAVLLFGPNDGVRLVGVPAASLTADRFVFAGGSTGGGTGGDTGGGTGGGDMTGQTITGTSNRDYLIGGALNDEISSGAGNDYIEGGAGSDLFKFAAGDGWDYIQDFQAGATGDVIDLSGWGSIRSMADISITSDSSGTSLVFGPNDGVRLNGVSAGSLTAANFHFAGGGTGGTGETPSPHVLFQVRAADGSAKYMIRELGESGAQPASFPPITNLSGWQVLYASDEAVYLTNTYGGLYRQEIGDSTAQRQLTADQISSFAESGGYLYYAKYEDGARNLYRVDPQDPNAGPVNLGYAGNIHTSDYAVADGRLFTLKNYSHIHPPGYPYQHDPYGNEPAYYDLNALNSGAPPTLIADLLPGVGGRGATARNPEGWDVAADSTPHSFVSAGHDVFFAATTPQGEHLFRLDARTPETSLTQIDGSGSPALTNIRNLTPVGDDLYFTAEAAGTGVELYRIGLDGPGTSATLVADLLSGATGSYPGSLTAVGDQLYFAAQIGNGERGLYHIALDGSGPVNPVLEGSLGVSWPDARQDYLFAYGRDGARPFDIINI